MARLARLAADRPEDVRLRVRQYTVCRRRDNYQQAIMIELYSWSTPNGRKVSIALEEMELEYRYHPIDIGSNEQFAPEFLAVSPNNKIPAIRDGELSMFESGAILIYLARKSGRFLAPEGTADYWMTLQWLMWQMGGLGPMLGQAHHFLKFNPGISEYAEKRYHTEALRLYGVLDRRLSQSEYVSDADISIADFAIWPWVSRFEFQRIDLAQFEHVRRWYLQLADRPGVQRGYSPETSARPDGQTSEQSSGQTAARTSPGQTSPAQTIPRPGHR